MASRDIPDANSDIIVHFLIAAFLVSFSRRPDEMVVLVASTFLSRADDRGSVVRRRRDRSSMTISAVFGGGNSGGG